MHKSTQTSKSTEIEVGYERFLGPEMFFHPEFIHQDWKSPIDEVIDNAILSCPIDYRKRLYKNIVLSGGSTLFDGFDQKVQKLVKQRVDERTAIQQQELIDIGSDFKVSAIEVNVMQNMVQRYAVWFGGSVLGCKNHFPMIAHSKAAYEEHGPSIARHNPIFSANF